MSDRTKQHPTKWANIAEERLQLSCLGKIRKELDDTALAAELPGLSKDAVILPLFLALLQQRLHHASDKALGRMLSDNLVWMAFCGLDPVREKPSSATLVHFRNCLHQTGKWKRLLAIVNVQLAAKGCKLKYGNIEYRPLSLVKTSAPPSAENSPSGLYDESALEREDGKPQ